MRCTSVAAGVGKDIVHPRLQSGGITRPLNFTVRVHSCSRPTFLSCFALSGSFYSFSAFGFSSAQCYLYVVAGLAFHESSAPAT